MGVSKKTPDAIDIDQYQEVLDDVRTLGNSAAKLANGQAVVAIASKYVEEFEKLVDKNPENLKEQLHELTKNLTKDIRAATGGSVAEVNAVLQSIDEKNDIAGEKKEVPDVALAVAPPDAALAGAGEGMIIGQADPEPARSDEEIVNEMNCIAAEATGADYGDVNAPYLAAIHRHMDKMYGLEVALGEADTPENQREIKSQMLQTAAKISDSLNQIDPDINKLSDAEQSNLGISEMGRADNVRTVKGLHARMEEIIDEFADNNHLDEQKLRQEDKENEMGIKAIADLKPIPDLPAIKPLTMG